jgi:hypothetical protein
MISKITHRVLAKYMASEEGMEALRMIIHVREHPGWKHFITILIDVGNELANLALSPEFQRLSANEKMVKLESYSVLSQFIKWAVNPTQQMQGIIDIKQHNLDASRKKRPKGALDGRGKIKSFPRAGAAR